MRRTLQLSSRFSIQSSTTTTIMKAVVARSPMIRTSSAAIMHHNNNNNTSSCRRFKSTSTNVIQNDDSSNNNNNIPIVNRLPMKPYPLSTERRIVPGHIERPSYASTGLVLSSHESGGVIIHNTESISLMRDAAQLARKALNYACSITKVGITTDEIDKLVHEYICQNNAYPSPLNYYGFPKSICSSVNEIICHGIPDTRPLQFGDVVSFDVSCFLNGVHGDNCATIIVGDNNDNNNEINNNESNNSDDNKIECDWRGVPYRTKFATIACKEHFIEARRLVKAARESLYAAIEVIKPGNCLTQIGDACQYVVEQYGYTSVQKYRGHGIYNEFHIPPYIKHYKNNDKLILKEGMIFTIEPMICQYKQDCYEWESDEWTVATIDNGLAAQFEHTILITNTGCEILTTIPGNNENDY